MNNENLFYNLREEIKQEYGFTSESLNLTPFQEWRERLQSYPSDFKDEWGKNIEILKEDFGLMNLESLKNQKKKLILFVGLPGSGKTTLARILKKSLSNTFLLRGHEIVDALELYREKESVYRERLKERGFNPPDPWYLSYLYQEGLVDYLLKKGYNVILDDNIRTRANRRGYYDVCKKNSAEIVFVQINTPFKTALEREEDREHKEEFLADFVFQGEDFTDEEKREYHNIIMIDGTKEVSEIENDLIKRCKD